MEEAIRVENLYYMYPNGTLALKGVNLVVRKGEKLAIIGSNGAGKTTLIKHFNGLLKPSKGKVLIYGVDTRTRSVAELSRIVGIVFQNPQHQFFSETVKEELEFALRNFGYPKDVIEKRVEAMLKMFQLEMYADQSPFMLSGGEMRRLALASILAYDPDIIVLDEPTVGQDRVQKDRLAEIIRMLELQGKTVIVVTHDVEFVAENFNRVVILHDGIVVRDGSVREIFYEVEDLIKANLIQPVIPRLVIKCLKRGVRLTQRSPLTAHELAHDVYSKVISL